MIENVQTNAYYERDDGNVSYVVTVQLEKPVFRQIIPQTVVGVLVYDKLGNIFDSQHVEMSFFKNSHLRRVKPKISGRNIT